MVRIWHSRLAVIGHVAAIVAWAAALVGMPVSIVGCDAKPGAARDDARRVIVLGFDGVDPQLVREYIEAGELPNLARLARRGTLDELATTNPAESPVSWASFSAGANPGKTNIFDFLYRVPDTYIPDIALVERDVYRIDTADRLGIAAALGFALAVAFGLLYALTKRFALRRWRGLPPTSLAIVVLAMTTTAVVFGVLHRYVPDEIPKPVSGRKGDSFWRLAGAQGLASSILQVPVTFPAESVPQGRLLTGLGTPDLLQTWGTFAIYASHFPQRFSDPVNALPPDLERIGFGDSVTNGKLVQLEFPSTPVASVKTFLYGPDNFTISAEQRHANPLEPTTLRPELTITIDRREQRATFEVAGREVSAKAGEWTDWLAVDFDFNPLFSVSGIVRFLVREAGDEFYAYASPIQFDPRCPPPIIALSSPHSFSNEVTRQTGHVHETLGWAIATNPLKDELIQEDEFLADARFTFDNRWRIIESELARDDWRLLVGVLLAPDRVQHMFWRYIDTTHPLYDPDAPERYRQAILESYRAMDRCVGEVIDSYLDARTDLYVVSDHGFASFRKGVHLNSWLIDQGFMTLKDPSKRGRGRLIDITQGRTPFDNVDWSRTVAYSMGLGKIYLNQLGREPEGCLESEAELEATRREIIERLEALTDPESGRRVVHKVYRREELYRGPYAEHAADLIIGFERGYRVSWDTAAGKAPPSVIEANHNKWSGDHCSVDPTLVPGFIVSSRPLARDDPSIIDIARTVLTSLGVTIPAAMEGRDLLDAED